MNWVIAIGLGFPAFGFAFVFDQLKEMRKQFMSTVAPGLAALEAGNAAIAALLTTQNSDIATLTADVAALTSDVTALTAAVQAAIAVMSQSEDPAVLAQAQILQQTINGLQANATAEEAQDAAIESANTAIAGDTAALTAAGASGSSGTAAAKAAAAPAATVQHGPATAAPVSTVAKAHE